MRGNHFILVKSLYLLLISKTNLKLLIYANSWNSDKFSLSLLLRDLKQKTFQIRLTLWTSKILRMSPLNIWLISNNCSRKPITKTILIWTSLRDLIKLLTFWASIKTAQNISTTLGSFYQKLISKIATKLTKSSQNNLCFMSFQATLHVLNL